MITDDMRAVVESAHLCFAATVTPDGRPSLSPKGTIRVWDGTRLFFLDIASPGTRENLSHSPWIELNVVDQLSRRGYRFLGRAECLRSGEVFEAAVQRVLGEEGADYPVQGVVLVTVERAAPLVSPGYLHVPTEAAMRASWAPRRAALDAAFERHLALARASGTTDRAAAPPDPDAPAQRA
jgi:predicted pyridoxine 5'-phosphate oxidase superfamily flavin-nucleotide-binding protein